MKEKEIRIDIINASINKYGIENLFKGPTGYEGAVPSEMSYIMSKIKNEPFSKIVFFKFCLFNRL